MIRNALLILALATWALGLTIGFGFLVHELRETKEQAVIARGVSARANDNTDKWGREYYFHIRLYHEK